MKSQVERVREMMQEFDRGRSAAAKVLGFNPDTKRLEVMPQEEARARNVMRYHPEDKGFYGQRRCCACVVTLADKGGQTHGRR